MTRNKRQKATITGGIFIGSGGGIRVGPDVDLTMRDNTFIDTSKIIEAADGSTVDAQGTRRKKIDASPAEKRTVVGYSGKMGPSLPAQCPNCQTIFPSKHYDIGSSAFYGFDNEDICPECGNEHARLADGLFDLTGPTIRILRAPDITRDMVQRFLDLQRLAVFGDLRAEDVIRSSAAIHPEFGEIAQKYVARGWKAGTFLLAVIGAVVTLWDFGEKIGLIDDSAYQQKVIEQALRNHETLFDEVHLEKLKYTDQKEGGGEKHKSTRQEAQKKSASSTKSTKLDRATMKNQNRFAFGRSRTR